MISQQERRHRRGIVVGYMLAASALSPLPSSALEVTPWTVANRRDVVLQEEDLSCGAAAAAMAMRLLYRAPVQEKDVLDALGSKFRGLSANARQLVEAIERLGYRARALPLGFAELSRLEIPVILFIKPPLSKLDIGHFVVLIKVTDDGVFYKDPTYGNRILDVATFREYWETRGDRSAPGVVVAILPKSEDQRRTVLEYRAPPISSAEPMTYMR